MAYSSVIEKKEICLIQAILVISMCCTGIVHSSPGRPEPLADPKIVILGATGVGKSSVANVLLGESPDCKNCTFPICDGSDSCTNETKYAEGKWLGLDIPFTIVDTPGFGDSEGRDDQFIDEMVDVLVHHVNTTNVFLLTFNGEDPRMDGLIKQMIREMEMLFGYKFWDNVILEATHWAYSENDIRQRNSTGKDEEWWTKDKNEALRKEYHLDHDLDAVFIDSWAKQDWNIPDTSQQEAFNRETEKLWMYAMNNTPFAFRTIEDVLADLEECQRTLEGDIAELKAEMEEVKKNFTEVEDMISKETVERKMNDDSLTDVASALQSDLSDEIMDRKTIESQLQENINNVNRTLTESVDSLSLMPIGSIVAWVIKPNKDSNQNAVLPDGWMRCDGSTIPPPSIWEGFTAPNLNGEKQFLRGGSDEEYLDTEMDQIQDLGMSLSDSGHTHSESGHSHDDIDDLYMWGDHYCHSGNHNSDWGAQCVAYGESMNWDAWAYYNHRSISTEHITIHDSYSGITLQHSDYRRGSETRPMNTKVIWIIRIW